MSILYIIINIIKMAMIFIIIGILICFFILFPIFGFILEFLSIIFNVLWYFIKKTLKFIIWVLVILFILAAFTYS